MADPGDALYYVLGSEEFYDFYKEHILPYQKSSDQDEDNDLLDNYLEKIRTPECRVSVLGIQGAGKSSLLNSLIFQDEVLPVAVEETTCIPTMVRRVYKGETNGAEVHYEDGRVDNIPLDREFLSKIVDNKYNPGNIMGASYVLCKVDSSFLKEGFVFVDLPGVGSLTEQNEKTTLHFLKETHVGIFVLRTVPPITNSEAGFIRTAWPMIQHSVFVQNLWMQETEEEIDAGMEHNIKVLKSIAEEKSAKMPESIVPVNISEAYNGVCMGDKDLIESSNLNNLKDSIRRQTKGNFVSLLHRNTAAFFIRLIKRARKNIKSHLSILRGDRDKILAKFEEEKKKYWASKESLEVKIAQHCEDFQEQISEIRIDGVSDLLDSHVAKMLEKIDAMPIESLKEEDFRQTISDVLSSTFSLVYKELRENLARVSEEYVENLGNTLQEMASFDSLTEDVYEEEQKKDPKAAKGWMVALSGSVAPLVIVGPAGWGILGGSLLAGSLVRWISGATAHKRIMRNVRRSVNDSKNKVREEMLTEVEQFNNSVINAIQETVSSELEYYTSELEKLEKVLRQEKGSQEKEIARLKVTLEQTKTFIDALSQV